MKKAILPILLLIASVAGAVESRDQLVKYFPRNSFMVAGADFAQMQNNEVYQSMNRRGQIWSYDEDDGIAEYVKILKLDTQKDIRSFGFAKYVNNYGGSGKTHIFLLNQDGTRHVESFQTTPYLDATLYRLSEDRDMYAVLIAPTTLAVGKLTEAKMAVDVARGKVPAMLENPTLSSLYGKIPAGSAVWGLAIPLSRRKAADVKAKQSTNAVISGFQNYYFYGIPSKTSTRTKFVGQAEDDKQAAFISSFMIGTVLVTKFRAEQPLAEALDQIDIQHNGNTVHVTMVITKEMVDAYFSGKLGL
jgi:hypothetical protein